MKLYTALVLVTVLSTSGAFLADNLLELKMLSSLLSRKSGTPSRGGGGSSLLGSIGQRSGSGSRVGGGGLHNLIKLHYCKETPSFYKMMSCSPTRKCALNGLLECVGGMCCAKNYGALEIID